MKNRIKILLLTCVLTLAMCVPAFAKVVEEYNGMPAEQMKLQAEGFFTNLVNSADEDLDQAIQYYKENGMEDLAKKYENIKAIRGDIKDAEFGDFVMETIENGEGDIKLTLKLLVGEKQYKQELTLAADPQSGNLQVADLSITSDEKESMSSLMARAGLNTLLGMGIVFIVLILISFLISLFKYLPGSSAKKAAPAPKVSAAPAVVSAAAAPAPAAAATDDKELIAVISAAVAAAMGTTSTDGFVVRSIKKRKW